MSRPIPTAKKRAVIRAAKKTLKTPGSSRVQLDKAGVNQCIKMLRLGTRDRGACAMLVSIASEHPNWHFLAEEAAL